MGPAKSIINEHLYIQKRTLICKNKYCFFYINNQNIIQKYEIINSEINK